MSNPEKLATKDGEKSRSTTQYVLNTIIRKQTQVTQIRH